LGLLFGPRCKSAFDIDIFTVAIIGIAPFVRYTGFCSTYELARNA